MAPENGSDTEIIARDWVKRFSSFSEWQGGSKDVPQAGEVVLLTGSTGAIGCHILHSLVQRPNVARVYCLIRSRHSSSVANRLDDVLRKNHLDEDLTNEQRSKAVAMPYDVYSQEMLGLSGEDYKTLRGSVTVMIHNAWAVNFKMGFADFEPHCRGTFDLINLALESDLKTKPVFILISTAAAVLLAQPKPARETLHGFQAAASGTSYGLSKWIVEQVCAAAAQAGLSTRIVRLGQICGDTKHGLWNIKEAWPLIVASAVTMGVVPATQAYDEKQYWLPADVTGSVIADLALLDQVDSTTKASVPPLSVFHVANIKPVLWKAEVLPALRRHGLNFEVVSWTEWVGILERSDSNVLRNPPYRLLNFFKTFSFARREGAAENNASSLDTSKACKFSPRLAEGIAIDDTLIGKFVRFWMTQLGWTGQDYPAKM